MKSIQSYRLSLGENVVRVAGTARALSAGIDPAGPDGAALTLWLLVDDPVVGGAHYAVWVLGEGQTPPDGSVYVGTASGVEESTVGGAGVWHVFAGAGLQKVTNV